MMEGIEGVGGIFINAIMGSRRQYLLVDMNDEL